ncbi:hypothetical_protein (plasmid) [Leishmania braziliensis MHOM/BR/75/M2904]|uniref:Hypothetical_protein n=1 Tax=Leishmania braziliensis MHOM/BR/75/M2904 TaxID=420245 RepID=A0A3P3YWR3_LEIBR|nr:hypothetical_protein [Leishmania braziliensis MHOM/BR/75/M2904]
MKVPQFLSDVRYVMGGMHARPPPPPADAANRSTYAPDMGRAECMYWGSLRLFGQLTYNSGLLFMLDRLLAGVVLEPRPNGEPNVAVLLAATDFDPSLSRAYHTLEYHHEDVLLGLLIRNTLRRARDICPNNRVWFIKEGLARFHDMHRDDYHDVTWSTVVAHRCTPANITTFTTSSRGSTMPRWPARAGNAALREPLWRRRRRGWRSTGAPWGPRWWAGTPCRLCSGSAM